jgi:hypothetical protein
VITFDVEMSYTWSLIVRDSPCQKLYIISIGGGGGGGTLHETSSPACCNVE